MRACASTSPSIVPADWPTLIAAAIRTKERPAHRALRKITRFIINLLQPGCSSETYPDSTGREVAAFTPSDKCCSLTSAQIVSGDDQWFRNIFVTGRKLGVLILMIPRLLGIS